MSASVLEVRHSVLVVLSLVVFAAEPSIARDIEVEYDLDEDIYRVDIDDENNPSAPIVPVIVRPTAPHSPQSAVRNLPPRFGESNAAARDDTGRSLWYGDSYVDDWMYSLEDYDLLDDYHLRNRRDVGSGPDIYGYVDRDATDRSGASLGPRRVTGEILEMRLVHVPGVARRHVLAVVQTDHGLDRRILLGPTGSARAVGATVGDRITAVGEPRIVEGTSVLLVDSFERLAQRSGRSSGRQGQWYHGRILDTRLLRPFGDEQPNLLATVRLDDGTTSQVDLGPVARLPRREIQPDDRVTLMARVRNVNGEPWLMADLLRLRSETMQIDRSE